MKKFHFPLDRVRAYRKLQMETEEARLMEVADRLRAVEHLQHELTRQQQTSAESVRSTATTGSDHKQVQTYHDHAARMADILNARRQSAAADVASQRAALVDARRRYEALDQCRDNARRTWQRNFDLEQESLASELHLAKVARRRS